MISNRTKNFIKDYTKRCSNELEALPPIYKEWLTPEQAECACEVERNEVIKKAVEWLENNVCEATCRNI